MDWRQTKDLVKSVIWRTGDFMSDFVSGFSGRSSGIYTKVPTVRSSRKAGYDLGSLVLSM